MFGRTPRTTLSERLAGDDEAITLLFDAGGPALLAGPDRRLMRTSRALVGLLGAAPPAGITLGELVAREDRGLLGALLDGDASEALIRFEAAPDRRVRASATSLADGGVLLRLETLPQADADSAASLAHDAANSLAVALALAEQAGAEPALAAAILAARAMLRRLAGAPAPADAVGPIALSDLLATHAAGLAAWLAPSISLVIEPGPDPAVLIAQDAIARVLHNIAANARAAMQGGRIRITTARTRLLRARVMHGVTLAPGGYGVLAIADDGPGIPPDRLARLFTPGTSFTEGGAGLGLASSQALLREAGGAIELDSRVGQGTTARLYIPLAERRSGLPGRDAPPGPAAPPMPPGGTSLLLVEDDAAIRRALALSLGAAGYDVTACASAEAALLAPACALLVADLNLPGQDGLALVSRLRLRQPGLRAVILSGAVVTPPPELADVAILAKPATSGELLAALRGLKGPGPQVGPQSGPEP